MDWRKVIFDLYNKAQNPACTEQEAQTYREHAEYLAAKHGIYEAKNYQEKNIKVNVATEVFIISNPMAKAKYRLLSLISNHMDAQQVLSSNTNSGFTGRVTVFGYPSDLEIVKTMFFSLLAQMHIEMYNVKIPLGTHAKSFRHAWALGFTNGVSDRLYIAKNRAKDEVPGTDLILANKGDAITKFKNETFTNLKPVSITAVISDQLGWQMGVDQGRRADIGQTRINNRSSEAHQIGG